MKSKQIHGYTHVAWMVDTGNPYRNLPKNYTRSSHFKDQERNERTKLIWILLKQVVRI